MVETHEPHPKGGRPTLSPAAFQVPPRFATATFASYQPDVRYPSQQRALEHLQGAMAELDAAGQGGRGLWGLLRRAPEPGWQGLYLDGRFGVGKTHLLAACYHAAVVPKAYLTFQELTYVVGALGMAQVLDLFGEVRLICLDEFELDDPGNTMLATSFVRGAIERGARLVVTSNTLPGELGRGRFSADDFQREIGALSAAFEPVRIDGEDYRQRHYDHEERLPRIVPDDVVRDAWEGQRWPDLLAQLAAVHPLAYPQLLDTWGVLALTGVEPIPDQDSALRFVHLIDKAYDRCVPLVLSTRCRLDELFPSSYGYGGFERKFLRCRSRLYEMLSQPIERDRGADWLDDQDEEAAHVGVARHRP